MPPLHSFSPRTSRFGLLAFAAAGLLLSGCAAPDGPTPQELTAMLAPSLPASSAEAAPAPGTEELRFNGKTRTCSPAHESDLDGAWETSAPRVKVSDGSAEIGLRNADGSGESPVSVSVATPGEETYSATATLNGSDWTMLVFPDDFESGPTWVGTGAHTVVWSVGDDDVFVSCDGFVGA